MSRPFYTALYSLMIIGLYFSLSVIYQSCGNKTKESPSTDELSEKVEEVADNFTEESFFEDDVDDTSTENDIVVDNDDEREEATTSSSSPTSTSTSYSAPSTSSSAGFMVVAGNYLLENNASVMVRKLRSQGYTEAEKVVFDLSQYYTVVAGTYESRSIAKSISSELSGKGIDNYVLKRKN